MPQAGTHTPPLLLELAPAEVVVPPLVPEPPVELPPLVGPVEAVPVEPPEVELPELLPSTPLLEPAEIPLPPLVPLAPALLLPLPVDVPLPEVVDPPASHEGREPIGQQCSSQPQLIPPGHPAAPQTNAPPV